MQSEIERCRREIAEVEAEILAGNPDVRGLCLALADWSAELHIFQTRSAAVRHPAARMNSESGDQENSAQTTVWSDAPFIFRGAMSTSALWHFSARVAVARIWSIRQPKFRSRALRK
jgi:hypothetical protein